MSGEEPLRIDVISLSFSKKRFNDAPPPSGGEAPPPPAKTFTQADIDRIVQERLGKAKKDFDKEKGDLLSKVNELSLTAQQKSELEVKMEELRVQSLSVEERLKAELDRTRKEAELKIKEANEKATKVFDTYSKERIVNEITAAAAAKPNRAINTETVVDILQGKARLVEELDAEKKPTGKYVVRVKHGSVDASPADVIKAMREDPSRYGHLFESEAAGGLGQAPKTGGKAPSALEMPIEEFVKAYNNEPEKIGLRKKG